MMSQSLLEMRAKVNEWIFGHNGIRVNIFFQRDSLQNLVSREKGKMMTFDGALQFISDWTEKNAS